MNGVIIVDKPAGFTSHDVVNRMRRILGQRSIGHLGTLDPLATGVLPLVAGSLTRLAQFYTASEKTYEGVIRFGFATDTYDADGDPLTDAVAVAPTLEELEAIASQYLGRIEQVPPPFSAKKIHGVPAYKIARKQQEVILKAVQVEVKECAITAVEGDRAHFRIRVSSGTYVRSIAHELGQRIGCGAHLESLRRTAVAEFEISQSHTLEKIESMKSPKPAVHAEVRASADGDYDLNHFNPGEGLAVYPSAISPAPLFLHPRELLPQFPSVTADEGTALRIRAGRTVNLPELSRARQVKVFRGQSELIAIATRIAGSLFHPKIVFPA